MRLKDKVIVVAGAGGIGNELARRYAREGAAVLLGDIDVATATAVAAEIVGNGGKAVGTRLDGADDASVKAAVDLAVSRFGGLDGVHANFACFRDEDSREDVVGLPLEAFDDVMRVNVRGFVLCTRHAVRAMLVRGGGSIVYTGSTASYHGETVRVAYAMSKAAVPALMRHVALRFGPDGIRANVIAPGVTTHQRFNEVMPPDVTEAFRVQTALRRLGSPGDIAAMGALLMSEDGRHITGQVISVDGGATMRS